ncbi:methyl-accepting chemotaxis protein [Geobacter sp. DSM 9736]|uniref:methyl-accepting chemotaxis protein n=1 Tax=Geobacter sp. DSM 9736 TaxID=1277350 RepID=UPI000B4FF0D4|nr:methyl-accepting chemotaxis protein [Geobacter sp. DSM 9736]SNB44786.1 methyl-accepting chemotaxis protein [Geobacter sp. DSM 9736]
MATIKSKLMANVAVVIVGLAAIVGLIFSDLKQMQALQEEVARRAADAIRAKEASMGGMALYQVAADAAINRDLAQTEKNWADRKAKVIEDIDTMIAAADTPEEKKLAEGVKRAVMEAAALFEGKMLPLLGTTDGITPEMRELDGRLDELVRIVETDSGKVVSSLEKELRTADEEFDAEVRNTIKKSLLIGLIAVLFQAGLAAWLIRSILRPINSMVALLRDMAEGEGDLTKRLDDTGKDEIAVASSWFNTFIGKIREIVGQVEHTSTQLASAATQMQTASEQIATGAEEVACQTGTVATASEEMAATSGEIAQNCMYAAEGARVASGAAESGSDVVRRTVDGMQRITSRVHESAMTVRSLGDRSDQIGAIIGTIEDIADQTNLLALNAAIEAARAGEQGRGFAVVADEVRALAERTTRATREIGEMIKSIQQETKAAVSAMEEGVREVEAGTEDAEKSGRALAEILEQINAVTQQVAQIATAAEEQTATTGEITSNIQQITEVVQSTAKGAIDSAGAAAQVNSLAGELHSLVRRFRA